MRIKKMKMKVEWTTIDQCMMEWEILQWVNDENDTTKENKNKYSTLFMKIIIWKNAIQILVQTLL